VYQLDVTRIVLGIALGILSLSSSVYGVIKSRASIIIISVFILIIASWLVLTSSRCVGWGCPGVPDVITF